jgi:hypothetical protein
MRVDKENTINKMELFIPKASREPRVELYVNVDVLRLGVYMNRRVLHCVHRESYQANLPSNKQETYIVKTR